MNYTEIEGDLIKLALEGKFDVIAHGCNCFCRMNRGLAPQMAAAFQCDEYKLEAEKYEGDIRKLGNIDFRPFTNQGGNEWRHSNPNDEYNGNIGLYVVNAYTQYKWGTELKPFDYDAFTLCMRKMNHIFKGKHIGLPAIGAGLAGADFQLVKEIIQKELKDCKVTVVIFKQ